jgi:hypothetical protein
MMIIALRELLNINGSNYQAQVSLVDRAKHVKIHGIELGIRNYSDPDLSQPNPEMEWTQEFEIIVHKTVGQKPLTQCTIPDGLWNLVMKFETLKGTDGGISEVLQKVRDLDAGPGRVESALFNSGLCMYLQKKIIKQPKGSKDFFHTIELTFIEANSGSV